MTNRMTPILRGDLFHNIEDDVQLYGVSHLPITLAFCGVDFDEAHRIIESALIDLEQSAARMVTHSHTYSTAIMTIQLAQRYADVLVALEGN